MTPGNSVSTPKEASLDRLLAMIERHVDLDHCREVDRCYRATLACEPVDRPPLVVRPPFAARLQLPAPWDAFTLYPHRQAYNDPVAMMQNQLLGSVVPAMLLEDDHPLLMDEDRIYAQTVARRVPFTNHRPPREELLNGHARRRFPTGVVFTFVGWDSAAQRNVFCRRSKNNGETWSEPVQISEPGHYCNNADRALRLSTGRILLPAHGTFSEKYIGAAPYGRGSKLHSFAFYSDDGGETWKRSANSMTAPGRGAHEPTVAELKDGRLLCFLRTTNQRIYRSYSADGGMHWSEPQPTDLPSPESPSLLKRIPATGDLLLLWNNVASKSNWPRTPLTAAISRDEGETWSIVGDIDNRPDQDAAYASAAFVNDEALVAYYTRPTSWARDCEIMLKIFDLAVFTH